MHGFSSRVTGLLQMLREGEREKVLSSLDPSIAEKIKERRQKERRAPGEGGIDAERSGAEAKARHTGVPDYDPATPLIESAGKYHTQKNPEDGEFSEDQSDPFDFATCQRPDGSTYGTGGQCRKGKEISAAEAEELQKRRKGKEISAAEVEELQKRASTGDKEAMKRLTELRANGTLKPEKGWGPGAKARETAKETKELIAKTNSKSSKIESGEKFIKEARTKMKEMTAQLQVAKMRLNMREANRLEAEMKKLRAAAEKIGGELDELTGTKGQGKYYIP